MVHAQSAQSHVVCRGDIVGSRHPLQSPTHSRSPSAISIGRGAVHHIKSDDGGSAQRRDCHRNRGQYTLPLSSLRVPCQCRTRCGLLTVSAAGTSQQKHLVFVAENGWSTRLDVLAVLLYDC